MKILFVSDTYYPHINGVYYFVARIGPLLQEQGHQVAVIAPSTSMFFTKTKVDNLDVYGVGSIPVLFYPNFRVPISFGLRSRITQVLEVFQPDIIHLQDHFIISRTTLEVSREWGFPIIGTNHFMPENLTALIRSEKWKKRLEKFCWAKFSAVYNQLQLVTTPTETAAQLIRPRLDVEVIPVSSGVDLKKFIPYGNSDAIRNKYGIPSKPILLFVGRLDPEKHIDEVLHAIATLASIDFCFVITGKGLARPALERLTNQLGLIDRVIFTGFVDEADLPRLYSLSHCFIIASTAELLSLGTLQAMACGLPVIAVRAGALPELVLENQNGFLFEAGDLKTMAGAIKEIFTNNAIYRDMSEKSIEIANTHSIDTTLSAFETIYREHSGTSIIPVFSKKRPKQMTTDLNEISG